MRARIVGSGKPIKSQVERTGEVLPAHVDKGYAIGGKEYEGAYIVIPSMCDQELPTKDCVLREDVEIKEIPAYRVDNPEGGTTITIGVHYYGN